ncbi:UDP-N-acetylmuramoyl-L-alanine--D-glutamate ligase [Breznakiellaceae bacterium SP9]
MLTLKQCYKENIYAGMKVLIMGLGINGGGVEAACYLARQGADITVTDLRSETELAPSIEKLGAAAPHNKVRYVLGRHEMADFKACDMVIKNPIVKPDSPFLAAASRIETDIGIFLSRSPARLIAVTGSKGKSSIASALAFVLQRAREQGLLSGRSFLGGNITVSPLSFLAEVQSPEDDVVLELSSWQLADLRGRTNADGQSLLKPRCALLSTILPDHQNWYSGMEPYIADKKIIYQGQDSDDTTIAFADRYGLEFLKETRARALPYSDSPFPEGKEGAWLEEGRGLVRLPLRTGKSEAVELVPHTLKVPGKHQQQNLLAAGLALLDLGLSADFIGESLAAFPGLAHRLEYCSEYQGIRFYNDTTATIPEAAAAAVQAFEAPVILICGGTDKNLDFRPLARTAPLAKAIVLLDGSGTQKLIPLLQQNNVPFEGPFDGIKHSLDAALQKARAGDAVVLSPGAASFGMFINEFDRGRKWKEAVLDLAKTGRSSTVRG